MRENEISVFNNDKLGKVRTVLINGTPYFVGKDVAEILGYTDLTHTILDHVSEDDRINSKTQGYFDPEFGQRGAWLINESGVYALIFGSKLESAKAFKRWVTSEVLPQIRKTGKYKGKSPVAIECTKKRNLFTQTLQEHGVNKPYEYANITIAMKEPFGLDGIKKQDMPDREKLKIAAAETLAMAMLYNENGYAEVKPVCVDASETVEKALVKKVTA